MTPTDEPTSAPASDPAPPQGPAPGPMPGPGALARPALGIGMVGYAFMGRVHSQAWRSAPAFFDLPVRPVMAALCGRSAEGTARAAEQMGWAAVETDWREQIAREDVDVVDICTPGDSHARIAIAALEAGKHVLCEKPLANTVAEAEAMADAARAAAARGVYAMVAFNYRRVPAIALAARWVAEGRLGEIRHVRAQYLQDWIVDPDFPLVWRLRRELAGSGALGDIGAHIIDTAQFITGQHLTQVSALTETFVTRRPLAETSAGLSAAGGGAETGRWTSTTRHCSSAGSAVARWPRSRPPGSPPGVRTRCASRSTARPPAWPSTSRP